MEQQDKLDQLVAENQELLALTKRAFVKREVEKNPSPWMRNGRSSQRNTLMN